MQQIIGGSLYYVKYSFAESFFNALIDSALHQLIMDADFSLRFLGTEACDMDWSRYGEAGIYGSTQTLVNDRVLIDAGRTGFRSLGRFGVAPEAIEEVWFTHYHDDHCFPEEVARLVQSHGTEAPLVPALAEYLQKRLDDVQYNVRVFPSQYAPFGSVD